MSDEIGFIGLGAMGHAMAGRLLAAGHRVRGFDVDPAALERFVECGGEGVAAPGVAAERADLVVVMVHDAAQVDAVLSGPRGVLAAMPEGATLWLATTVSPAYARDLGGRLDRAGIQLIDGPVSGGVAGARSGRLTVIAGGGAAAQAAAKRAMAACASHVFRIGDVGTGSLVKLVNQVLTAANIALTAEALSLGVRSGVDPRLLVEVIRQSAGTSRQFETRAPAMLDGGGGPDVTVKTFLKDLEIALETARELSFPTPLAALTHQIFTMAAGFGHAEDGDAAILRVYERFGGIDVAAAAGGS